jgi:hypothetical protein
MSRRNINMFVALGERTGDGGIVGIEKGEIFSRSGEKLKSDARALFCSLIHMIKMSVSRNHPSFQIHN